MAWSHLLSWIKIQLHLTKYNSNKMRKHRKDYLRIIINCYLRHRMDQLRLIKYWAVIRRMFKRKAYSERICHNQQWSNMKAQIMLIPHKELKFTSDLSMNSSNTLPALNNQVKDQESLVNKWMHRAKSPSKHLQRDLNQSTTKSINNKSKFVMNNYPLSMRILNNLNPTINGLISTNKSKTNHQWMIPIVLKKSVMPLRRMFRFWIPPLTWWGWQSARSKKTIKLSRKKLKYLNPNSI